MGLVFNDVPYKPKISVRATAVKLTRANIKFLRSLGFKVVKKE